MISDQIIIKNLEIFAYHGVLPTEKATGQTFIVSLTLHVDTYNAGNDDDLSKTINYAEVCEVTNDFVSSTQFDLIETVAEKLAEKLLVTYELLNAITVEIKKPSAPIELTFEYVSVEITRKWHSVYLSVGSNLGDKEANLCLAIDKIKENPKFKIPEISNNIVTKPYGPIEQDDFLNACISVKTLLQPYQLLYALKEIEKSAGRTPTVRWGPRTLDLDILLYDDLIMNEKELIIPHTDLQNRLFVLEPLSEIAPNVLHPLLKKTISELLTELKA